MVEAELMIIEGEEENNDEKKKKTLEEEQKNKLLASLFQSNTDTSVSSKTNLNKKLALAITIQTMYNDDLECLLKLFEFYIKNEQVEMAYELLDDDILSQNNKNKFNLTSDDKHLSFHEHFKKFAQQITSPSFQNNNIYLQLFLKLSKSSQQVLIQNILDKYRSCFKFLKNESASVVDSNSVEATTNNNNSLKLFYSKLSENCEIFFLMKDLLLKYPKYVADYGLYLIDGLFSAEKQLLSNNLQSKLTVEKRALNLMRRLSVIDLMPHFVSLLDKLDSKHSYRWIEKSLEFYTKYSVNAIQAQLSIETGTIKFNYKNIKLIQDCDLTATSIENLKDLIDYKSIETNNYYNGSSPLNNVYNLLDEIGRKLNWQSLLPPSQQTKVNIEDKMFKLFELKNDPTMAINNNPSFSLSSLNKQISFYGVSYFFQKLIEFQSIVECFFSDKFLMTRCFKLFPNGSIVKSQNDDIKNEAKSCEPIDNVIISLTKCLQIWHEFNKHKEFLTIVTKCLSNSKLDTLSCYKCFISDYYLSYSFALNINTNQTAPTWTTLDGLNLKQKIQALASLFINETQSIQSFFKEMNSILDQLDADRSDDNQIKIDENDSLKKENELEDSLMCPLHNYGYSILSGVYFDMFELNYINGLKYFSKLIIEKIFQVSDQFQSVNSKFKILLKFNFIKLLEQKKQNMLKFLYNNDTLMGHMLVLIQINLKDTSTSSIMDLYEIIFQSIRSKNAFEYDLFFDYIFDIQILQDFSMIIANTNSFDNQLDTQFQLLKIPQDDSNVKINLKDKLIEQVNKSHSDGFKKYQSLHQFFKLNSDILKELFDHSLNIEI
jgi:hypothetical protein